MRAERRPGVPRPAAMLVMFLALAACGEAGDEALSADADTRGDAAPASAAADPGQDSGRVPASSLRGALPGLFAIMLDLQGDMERISRGLWLEDHTMIAESARRVADHPTVPPQELSQVSAVLGEDLISFKAADLKVHDLAVALAEAARAAETDEILATDARLRAACVECHTTFRDRLRHGIARR